jgi:hypothetical protein
MKYTSEFDTVNNFCRVCVTGIFHSPEDGTELKQFARNFYAQHGCQHFLFDMTRVGPPPDIMTAFNEGSPQGEMAQSLQPFKVAVLYPAITKVERFFENVAVNRGFRVNVFDDLNKAIEWVKPKSEHTE